MGLIRNAIAGTGGRATENPNNWAAFTNLIAAVNNTSAPNYEQQVRTGWTCRNFLRPVIAHPHLRQLGQLRLSAGQNMFAARPDGAGWRLLMWDIEIALGAVATGPTDSIYNMFDPVLLNLITSRPSFQREYLRGFQEALDTALAPGRRTSRWMNATRRSNKNGVP